MSPSADTIYALSSGRLPAAIAVVRISGSRAGDALRALTGRIPEPRRAALARVRDPQSGEIIDEALALWFPGPKSETGEDVAELQLHGGRAVLAATFEALGRIEGLRPAEAGEFTRRAFANGQLDLTAVEGLADLIGAETEAQRRQAFRQMKGALGDKAEDWRKRLIEALALVEAGIDFADEDLPDNLMPQVRAKVQGLADEIGAALDDGRRGERLRDGLVVAIAGPPNAGKSTLLNRIARRDAAIVSPYPGTTRDVIEVHLDLGGYPVTLVDTAGIRETDDPVELEGVNRARARAAVADLVLWVVDATDPAPPLAPRGGVPTWLIRNKVDLLGELSGAPAPAVTPSSMFTGGPGSARDVVVPKGAPDLARQSYPADRLSLTPGDPAIVGAGVPARVLPPTGGSQPAGGVLPAGDSQAADASLLAGGSHSAHALGSNALASNALGSEDALLSTTARHPFAIPSASEDAVFRRNELNIECYDFEYGFSVLEETGVDSFLNSLTAGVSLGSDEPALITRARHRETLTQTRDLLMRALQASQDDFVAEELRLAARTLGRLTGRVDVEDILDVIFRDFCIGK